MNGLYCIRLLIFLFHFLISFNVVVYMRKYQGTNQYLRNLLVIINIKFFFFKKKKSLKIWCTYHLSGRYRRLSLGNEFIVGTSDHRLATNNSALRRVKKKKMSKYELNVPIVYNLSEYVLCFRVTRQRSGLVFWNRWSVLSGERKKLELIVIHLT